MDTMELNAGTHLPVPQVGTTRETSAVAQRELRQQILDRSKTLRDEYRGQHRQLSEAISRALHELRVEKADRAALAALFSELAMRMRHELALPGTE